MKGLSFAVNTLANMTNTAAKWGLVVAGAVMSLTILLQIVFRFLIYVPFPWSEELARYLMIWLGMMGSAVALRQGRHIGVTVLRDKLPVAMQKWVILITQAVMVLFLVFVAKEGWVLSSFNAMQLSPSMEISMRYPYLAIFAGAILMIVELLAGILNDFFPTSAGGERNSANTL